uniref:Uncharacterized protein n=1 Tax=Moniliophthora roreri TaxID=221103 RepID=A0A0W0F5F7_MONRR
MKQFSPIPKDVGKVSPTLFHQRAILNT